MTPTCPTHQKPMKRGKGGSYFCATPISKSPDGSTVLEWCSYKPGEVTTPQNQPIAEPLDRWGKLVNTPLREPTREPVKEPDWNEIALGKTRSLFIASLIQKRGLEPITKGDIEMLEGWLEYAFTGKVTKFPNPYPKNTEDLSPSEIIAIGRELEDRD